MKIKRFLTPLCPLILFAACTEGSFDTQEDIQKNKILIEFVKTFGPIAQDQNWNMASTVLADVNPAAFGSGASVEIYTANPNLGGLLIGRCSKPNTLTLDVSRSANSVFAVVRNAQSGVICMGNYEISGGKLAINAAPAKTGASRADAVITPAGVDKFQFTIACEDLGSLSVSDYDFNDIVFGINKVAGETSSTVEITPLAAGGTMAATIYIGSKEVGEIHNLLVPGSSTSTMLNTQSSGNVEVGETLSFTVNKDWSIGTDNMGDIRIVVDRPASQGGTSESKYIRAADKGNLPQMFCIEGDWFWPSESQNLYLAYSDFSEWVTDPTNTTWIENYKPQNVIKWKKVATPEYSKKMIDWLGAQWSSSWNNTSKDWDYVPGLVTKAIAEYSKQYNDEGGYYDADVVPYVNRAFNGDNLKWDDKGFVTGQLDNIASAKLLIPVYQISGDAKYKTAADRIYNYLYGSNASERYPRFESGVDKDGFFHKAGDYNNQMWLDGLYMGTAFMAEYLAAFNPEDTDGWDLIAKQFKIIHGHTYDATQHLNYHAWSATPDDDDSFWANAEDPFKGCSKSFWARGEGWYFAALVDVLALMPKNHADYNTLKGYFTDVAFGIKNNQKSNGVWTQLLIRPIGYTGGTWLNENNETAFTNGVKGAYSVAGGNGNYCEASASSMFTYALLKGLRLGLLDEATYGPVVNKAYQGLLTEFIGNGEAEAGVIDHDGKNACSAVYIRNICRSAGLAGRKNVKIDGVSTPVVQYWRDGSEGYYLNGSDVVVVANEGKAIGPFILASLEWELRNAE